MDRVAKTAEAIPASVYNAYLLRGLNEGFADFYGWVYSSDVSFLAKSLPEQYEVRRLDVDPGRLPSEALLRRLLVDNFHPESILSEAVRAHNAYSLGTVYARYLKRVVDDLVSSGRSMADARLLVARAVVATLPELGLKMESVYEREFVSPNSLIAMLAAHLPPLTSSICLSIEGVHASEPGYVKPSQCDAYSPTTLSAPAKPRVGERK